MATETEIERLIVRLMGDSSGLEKTVDQARSAMDKLSSTATALGGRMTLLGGALTAAFSATAIKSLVLSGNLEQTRIAFDTMLGSAEETQQTLEDLTQFAAKTPFVMPEILQATRGLIQFGERGDDLMDTLNILGNAAAGTSTNFGMLALIFNQVRGVGKLLTQDFRQLSTRGVISLQDIADHFDTTTAAAQGMLSAGEVSFEDLRAILKGLSSEGGRFFNLMEKQSQSLLGTWSTLQDNISIMFRMIGDELAPAAKLMVNQLNLWVERFQALSPVIKTAVGVTIGLGVALGTVLTTMGGVVVVVGQVSFAYSQLAATTRLAAVAQYSLNTALVAGKLALVGLAVGGVAIVAMQVRGLLPHIKSINKAFDEMNSKAREVSQKTQSEFESVIAVIKTLPDNMKLEKIDEIDKKLRETFGGLIKESNKLKQSLLQERGYAQLEGAMAFFSGTNTRIKKLNESLKVNEERLAGVRKNLKQLRELETQVEETPEEAPEVTELRGALSALNAELQQQHDLFGKNAREAKIYALELQAAKVGASELVQEELAMAQAIDRVLSDREDLIKRQEEAKQKAEELRLQNERNIETAKGVVEGLKAELATIDMTSRQSNIWKLKNMEVEDSIRGVVSALADEAKALDETLSKMEEERAARERGKAVIREFLTPTEKLLERLEELNSLRDVGAIPLRTFNRAMSSVEKDLKDIQKKAKIQVRFEFRGLEAGSLQDVAEIHRQIGKIRGGKTTGAEEEAIRAEIGLGRIREIRETVPGAGVTGEMLPVSPRGGDTVLVDETKKQSRDLHQIVKNTDPRNQKTVVLKPANLSGTV